MNVLHRSAVVGSAGRPRPPSRRVGATNARPSDVVHAVPSGAVTGVPGSSRASCSAKPDPAAVRPARSSTG
ncbi:hypothetical protein QLR68_35815, partial [Micromonospora sp. DH15]|nr:hypothetical protein [Micromonospora sp. DH15]